MRKKIKTYGAESFGNGICFYSRRHKNHVAIATVDEENRITTQWISTKEWRRNKDKVKGMKQRLKMTLCLLPVIIAFLVFTMVLDDLLSNLSYIYHMRLFAGGLLLFNIIIFAMLVMLYRKTDIRTFQFHSAEHMVLNAYEKSNKIPSLEEIKQYSRYSNSCGTNTIGQYLLMLTFFFISMFMPQKSVMIIILVIGIMVSLFLHLVGALNFFQRFTTASPTNIELTVAIEGMKVWLEHEKEEV